MIISQQGKLCGTNGTLIIPGGKWFSLFHYIYMYNLVLQDPQLYNVQYTGDTLLCTLGLRAKMCRDLAPKR
jgi:hypothetical protein